jgi:DMSO/TMAO reductase YedYZ molybdopterin-dependent catalytic subunit
VSSAPQPPADPRAESRRLTRRAFAIGAAVAGTAAAGWTWLNWFAEQDQGVAWPLRRFLNLNEALARATYSPARLAPVFPLARAAEPKVNGVIGLKEGTDAAAWRIDILDPAAGAVTKTLSIAEALAGLPRVEQVTELKCVEGWSEVVHWGGVRLGDFVTKWKLADRPDGTPYPYLSLTTPDGAYYIGLDRESVFHPQTLLCDMMGGAPLTPAHGGPLRLVTTLKYGIKNIKQIGRLRFQDTRPADYWAERGYDWYAGH